MAEYQEEIYLIEKREITDDEGEDSEFEKMQAQANEMDFQAISMMPTDGDTLSSDDDLNDFNALKSKTANRQAKKQSAVTGATQVNSTMLATLGNNITSPRTVERDVVIDDFIRNFLTKVKMTKTMNIFQQEWYELQKKGTFQDLGIGLITDIKNKNSKMEAKIERMTGELKQAKIVAENAKSTWEKLRKERDFHKHHQDRVNGEKVTITSTIKTVKEEQEEMQEHIEEMKKKHLVTVKEKALLKLEKDKLQRKAHELNAQIKENEMKVQRQIEQNQRRQNDSPKYSATGMDPYGSSTFGKGSVKVTPYPEDARPNPFLSREYENLPTRLSQHTKIDAHSRGIGGMALHMRKQIVATGSDDCTWKIFNMETSENIMTGEGHKDWIAGIDFHPAGSHLVTCGSDRSLKLWDFISSGIAHTFTNISNGPLWKAKFHDTGDFVLTSAADGAIKLFDLHAVKMRQQYRSHTDSVNGLMWQPFTNFFVSGSADKTVSIWDMRTGLTVQTFYGHMNAVNDSVFSIGGQFVASCDADGIIKLWDIRQVSQMLTVDIGDTCANTCTFDKTGKFLAVGCSNGEVKMLNVQNGGEVVSSFKAHEKAAVSAVLINQENNQLFTSGGDGIIKSWQ